MDVKNQVLVVGTAGRHIQVFDLSNPITPYKVGVCSLPVRAPFLNTRLIMGFPFFLLWVDGSIASEVAD